MNLPLHLLLVVFAIAVGSFCRTFYSQLQSSLVSQCHASVLNGIWRLPRRLHGCWNVQVKKWNTIHAKEFCKQKGYKRERRLPPSPSLHRPPPIKRTFAMQKWKRKGFSQEGSGPFEGVRKLWICVETKCEICAITAPIAIGYRLNSTISYKII